MAKIFEKELALAATQNAGNNIQQAMAVSSAILNNMDVYDLGYQEVRQIAGTLFNLWKSIKVETFDSKLESDLPELKKLAMLALEQTNDKNRGQLQKLVMLLNTIQV